MVREVWVLDEVASQNLLEDSLECSAALIGETV